MKNRIKLLFVALTLLLTLVFITSCGGNEGEAGTVVVRYNANGGTFTTNTYVETDRYTVSELPQNRFGNYEIPLVDPSDKIRGEENAFLASRPGYFLVGWYAAYPSFDENGKALDAEGKLVAESGNPQAYTYKKWDFENDTFELKRGSYTDGGVVLDVVAMWLPEFTFEFYDIDTGRLLKEHSFDPMYIDSLSVPRWDSESGKLNMYDFPIVEGKTYQAVYLDSHGIERVEGEKIYHSGLIDYDNRTAEGSTQKLYVKMNSGAWYDIYTAEQFLNAKDLAGNYNIRADLDFSEEGWIDEFIDGEFTGTIRGNGHKFKNITYYQSSTSSTTAGLFGAIADSALIEDVIFENLDFTIETGSRMPGASFGLFAGTLSPFSTLENVSVSGKLTVTPTPYITESTIIGLFCGTGDPKDMDISGIRCEALEPESDYDTGLSLEINGNTVVITVIPAKED